MLVIRSAGFFTTVQDAGRTGYQRYGMPVAGAMDLRSLALANILAKNAPGEAALEVTMLGPEIEFEEDTVIAVTGADLSPRLDGAPLQMYRALPVRRGVRLSFGAQKTAAARISRLRAGWTSPWSWAAAQRVSRRKSAGWRAESSRTATGLAIAIQARCQRIWQAAGARPRIFPRRAKHCVCSWARRTTTLPKRASRHF